jgi:hypothetical protein
MTIDFAADAPTESAAESAAEEPSTLYTVYLSAAD